MLKFISKKIFTIFIAEKLCLSKPLILIYKIAVSSESHVLYDFRGVHVSVKMFDEVSGRNNQLSYKGFIKGSD